MVAGGLCRSMAGRGLVSGSRRTKFRRVDGAELRQSPPATITSLDNAPQSTKNVNQPGNTIGINTKKTGRNPVSDVVDQTLRISNLRFVEGLLLIQQFLDSIE